MTTEIIKATATVAKFAAAKGVDIIVKQACDRILSEDLNTLQQVYCGVAKYAIVGGGAICTSLVIDESAKKAEAFIEGAKRFLSKPDAEVKEDIEVETKVEKEEKKEEKPKKTSKKKTTKKKEEVVEEPKEETEEVKSEEA